MYTGVGVGIADGDTLTMSEDHGHDDGQQWTWCGTCGFILFLTVLALVEQHTLIHADGADTVVGHSRPADGLRRQAIIGAKRNASVAPPQSGASAGVSHPAVLGGRCIGAQRSVRSGCGSSVRFRLARGRSPWVASTDETHAAQRCQGGAWRYPFFCGRQRHVYGWRRSSHWDHDTRRTISPSHARIHERRGSGGLPWRRLGWAAVLASCLLAFTACSGGRSAPMRGCCLGGHTAEYGHSTTDGDGDADHFDIYDAATRFDLAVDGGEAAFDAGELFQRFVVGAGLVSWCDGGMIVLVYRFGEALHPGPRVHAGNFSHGHGGVGAHEAAAEDRDLTLATVAMRASWCSWARCLRARRASGGTDPDDPHVRAGVENAARLGLATAVNLARSRGRWQSMQTDGGRDPGAERGISGPSGRRKKRADEDTLEVHPGDHVHVADIKRRLRAVADAVRGIMGPARLRVDLLPELESKVQSVANAIVAARTAARMETADGSGNGDIPNRLDEVSMHDALPMEDPRVRAEAEASTRRLANGSRSRARHGRHGRREHSKPREIDVLYANVNSFSCKAESHFLKKGPAIWLAAETHIRGHKLQETMQRIKAGGWRCTSAEARHSDTSDTGTQGGVLAATRSYLGVRPMAEDTRDEHGWRSTYHDMVGINIGLRGGALLVFGGYARGGVYHPLLRQVAKSTSQGRVPFVLLADFNVDPAVLEAEPAVAALDAVVLRPTGGTISCHQGTGSLIDFAIVSRAALPYVKLRLDREVPWRPHDGLRPPYHHEEHSADYDSQAS